jgi:nicotinamide-nucleotide amidase
MEAEIITIGTEILLGEIVDTNTRTLARELRQIGLDIFRTSTVGDNARRIAQAVQESMRRAAAVITTGGLGPTIDDATREGIAIAFGVEIEFVPELWDQIQQRFAAFGRKPTENNRRQAFIPKGAIPIENPVGTAPAFIMESETSSVISLPGVPAEMAFLMEHNLIPYLRRRLKLQGIIKSRILRTAGIGESVIDKRIEDLERLSNPTVGLSAHPGRVDIRITAKANSETEADEMIWGVEVTLRQRLGQYLYGVDNETLEGIIATMLRDQAMKVCTLECGTSGSLGASFTQYSDIFGGGQIISTQEDLDEAPTLLRHLSQSTGATCGIALLLIEEGEGYKLISHILLDSEIKTEEHQYARRFVYSEARAISFGLERLRRALLDRSPELKSPDS